MSNKQFSDMVCGWFILFDEASVGFLVGVLA